MKKLEELILFILDRAKKKGIEDLSLFQLFKISYLIQVLSFKYAGKSFLEDVVFIRHKNGPISISIYDAIEHLENEGYIKVKKSKKEDYEYERHGHELVKKIPKLSFKKGERIFLDSFLSELLPLSQRKLKEYAYSTEPMKEITQQERKGVKKGAVLNFTSVTVDPDVVDAYAGKG